MNICQDSSSGLFYHTLIANDVMAIDTTLKNLSTQTHNIVQIFLYSQVHESIIVQIYGMNVDSIRSQI